MGRRKGTKGTKHIDKDKERKEREVKEALRDAFACGDEERFLQLVKAVKPNLTREELVSLQNHFRLARRSS